jgi:PAS domain S-box-containing protein
LEASKTTAGARLDTAGENDLFRLLIHSVKDYAICLLDRGGYIASWNPGAERIKGYTEDEIIGKHFSVFFPEPVASSGWPEQELEIAEREGRFEEEGWRLRKDGSYLWANVVITAVRDSSGKLHGFAKVTRDLTERKRDEESVRQSEERYRMLVEHVRDYAIFLLDADGRVVTWNVGAERLKGYRAEEIIGQHFSVFYPPEAVASMWPQRELELASAEGRFEDEGWRLRKDGTRFWANVVITALYNAKGQVQGFSKVTRDMSERRELEQAVRKLNDQLTLRVQQLAETNRTLSEKNRENETFVYSVSHDVRGPLVNLQGFSQEVQRSCGDLLELLENDPGVPPSVLERARSIVNDDMAESARFLQTAVAHLSNIVDALLRLSRLGRVVYQNELVDVAATVRRVLDSLRGSADEQQAEIVVGELPPVQADPGAVEQIFNNLVVNALRYRDPARPCRIEIGGAVSPDGRTVVYHVKDNGLGIPASAIPKLFIAFRRFHPECGPGEGMGLAMLRGIVERLHGSIRVESTAGAGSTFFVELPVREAAAV